MLYVLSYFSLVLLIGGIAAWRLSPEGFMMADRRLGGWAVGASISAGFFDAFVLAAYTGYVYQFGLSALWLFVGMAAGLAVFAAIVRPIKAQADSKRFHTMADYFFARFPEDTRPGWAVTGLVLVFFFALLLIQLIFGSQILSFLTGWPYAICVVLVGGTVILYLGAGGFRASVMTDAFQWGLILLLSAVVGLAVRKDFAPTGPQLAPFGMGIGVSIAFFVIGALNTIVAADLWQRAYAARSLRSLRRGLLLAGVMLPLSGVIIAVIGVATRHHFPGLEKPTEALLYAFGKLLGESWRGLGYVILFAAIMSSADTMLFVIGSSTVKDILGKRRSLSEAHRVRLVRWALLGAGVLGVVVAVLIQDILTIALAIGGLGIGLCPAVLALRFFNPRGSSVFASIIAGLVVVVVLLAAGQITPETSLASLPAALITLLVVEPIARRWQRRKSE